MSKEFYDWKEITVKYPGNCINCSKQINVDEQAMWMQNLGIKHLECPVESELPPQDNSSLVIIDEEDKRLLGY